MSTLDVFEAELATLIERSGVWLTDDQIIHAVERALDEALVTAGEQEASKTRRELVAALKPFADLGVGEGPDNEHDNSAYRLLRGSIRSARAVIAKAGG